MMSSASFVAVYISPLSRMTDIIRMYVFLSALSLTLGSATVGFDAPGPRRMRFIPESPEKSRPPSPLPWVAVLSDTEGM